MLKIKFYEMTIFEGFLLVERITELTDLDSKRNNIIL